MSPTKSSHNFWLFPLLLLIGILCINALLAYFIPVKQPKIVAAHMPSSAVDSQIRIEFSELMNQHMVEEAFTITPSVEGKMSWAGRLFAFTPNEALDFGATYTVEFSQRVISERGQALDSKSYEFLTPEKQFLYIDQNGGLQQYSLQSKKSEMVSSNEYVVTAYDYDPHGNRVVALTAQKEDLRLRDLPLCPRVIDIETTESFAVDAFCNNATFQVSTVKFLPFENALMVVGSDIIQYDESLSGASLYADGTKLIRYDLDTGEQTLIRTGAALTYGMYPSPDGMQVLLIDDTGSLILKNLADGKEQFIVKDFLSVFGFSEYGGFILYTIAGDAGIFDFYNNLVMLAANGAKQLLLENVQGSVNSPTLAPDESMVAFKFLPEQQLGEVLAFQLKLKSINEAVSQVITQPQDGGIDQPVFSPDGEEIAFIQFPVSDDISDPIAGFNEFENNFVSGQINLYVLARREVVSTTVEGSDVTWLY